ncbi:hypothetical protein IEQ34_018905 [Dendrobium chrysotoxum]|uniref:Uncharacterized protein n=1 Tax=Dendrobium chrysotoxum TaxID=161865 RepID=A0AAV7G5D5_DENCH|nr:hypothetical protein IEQ34_018905 [Dendrobium chrysotoxum]
MLGDHLPSKNSVIRGDPIAPYDCEWGPNKEASVNEIASTVTSDFLILFCKNFHFLNVVVTIVPKRSDRASLPPPGYLTISETNLRAGLRFPPPAELIKILQRSGMNLSQFLFRAMSVTVGLIALFRDRRATLTPEHLSWMGRFTSDTYGHVTFRSKWLDLRTRDPSKNWANAFFFVKNDWGLLEKWGKMKDLPAPLHVQKEDIMRILKVLDIEHLLFEVRHISRYIEEEFLFKVGLSFHAGRSDAKMLKPTSKVPEPPAPSSKVAPDSSPAKLHIPEEILNHQCIRRHKADDLWSRLGIELTDVLNEWNSEFISIKWRPGRWPTLLGGRAEDWRHLEAGKKTGVTRKSGVRRTSYGGRAEDRGHSKVGQKTSVTWRLDRRPTSLGGRAEDRHHSEVGCKIDITWRLGRRPTSLRNWVQDRHHMEAEQKADITRKSNARPASHGGRAEGQHHSEVGCKTDVTRKSGARPASHGGRAEDQRHSEVERKTGVTWRPGRKPTSLGSWV